MLIKDGFVDLQTSSNVMRVFTCHPVIPNAPGAKFPCVVVFAEIYQVTAPVLRLCRLIAGRGYIVACPSSFHEFEGARAMDYSPEDTALGNAYKVRKSLAAYDEDADLVMSYLQGLGTSTGKIGATGICLGGHLAFRAALNPAVSATVTFFGTDIHSSTLSAQRTDTLDRVARGDVAGEMCLIFGKLDGHVPREGRDLIRASLDDAGVTFTWLELAWAQHGEKKGTIPPL